MAKTGQPGAPWPKLGKTVAQLGDVNGGATIAPLDVATVDVNCNNYNPIAELAHLRW